MPFVVGAIVLWVAALAKLRSPGQAAGALGTVGAPVSADVIRLFALFELGVGAWALVSLSRPAAAAMAAMYAGFAVVAIALSRRGASCGCFGTSEATASPVQAAINVALALVSLWVALHPGSGLSWLFGRAPIEVGILCLGILTAAYATVVAYTELPGAWSAWSRR